jgi:hypothetical protein
LQILLAAQQRGVQLPANLVVIDRSGIGAMHLLPNLLAADAEPRAGLRFG